MVSIGGLQDYVQLLTILIFGIFPRHVSGGIDVSLAEAVNLQRKPLEFQELFPKGVVVFGSDVHIVDHDPLYVRLIVTNQVSDIVEESAQNYLKYFNEITKHLSCL